MLKLNFKKIVSIGLTTAIFVAAFTSLSIDTLAYATCTDNLKKDLNAELNRLNSISNGKTDIQNNQDLKNRISEKNNISYGNFDKIIQIIRPLALKEISKSYINSNSQSTISFANLNQNNDLYTGIIEEDRQSNYDDGSNGFSKIRHNFEYNQTKNIIKVAVINDNPVNYEKLDELSLTDFKKAELLKSKIENGKINNTVNPNKARHVEESKKDRTEQYNKQKEDIKKQLDNAGCTVNVKAGSGIYYNRIYTKDYARTFAYSRNSTFADYDMSDCTNFASQSLFAGRMLQYDAGGSDNAYSWYSRRAWWGGFDSGSVSRSWREVNSFMTHMYYYENTGPWLDFRTQGYSIFDPLLTGDLLFADWDGNGTWDHTMIITGWTLISGHWEPKLTYHSNNNLDTSFNVVKNASTNNNPNFRGLQIYDGQVW